MINAISFSNVSVSYGDVGVFRNISFDIGRGEFVSIVGPSGSGKSTIVRVLAGFVSYEGYINVDGYVLDGDNIRDIRSGMAFVLDDVGTQFMGETVFDDLAFNMENLRYSRDDIEREVMNVASLFGILDILDMDVKYITNSKRQVLAIASSLVTHPSILVMDDCLHQLSVSDKRRVFKVLKRYQREEDLTVVMVSNDMDDVINGDRVIVINDGEVKADDTVVRVFRDRKMMVVNGLEIPFVIDLSLRLMDEGVISHIYLDERKLVRDLWK